MPTWLALITVLVVVVVSLIVTRVATVALMQTGMSRHVARFQARSALSGTGFTTGESESVVNHPVRRRVIGTLMLVGSAGLVTAVGSLALSFGAANTDERLRRGAVLLAGLSLLLIVANSRWVDRRLSRLIGRLLGDRVSGARDYARLLDLSGDYAVNELLVESEDWVAERTLGQLRLDEEGVIVLGVHRSSGGYVGVPAGDTRLHPQDTLILYGQQSRLEELDERGQGNEGAAAASEARAEHAAEAEASGADEAA